MGLLNLSNAEIIYIYDVLKGKMEELEKLNMPQLVSQDVKIITRTLRKLDQQYPGLSKIHF